jgi:hypothetical protein
MTKEEIKKALYREKPIAHRYAKSISNFYYCVTLKTGEKLFFTVPTKDMGDCNFGETEQAQLLIRYINT